MFPIRCFTCGRPIAQYWEKYKERVLKGEDPEKVLDDLGIKSYCCRRMFISWPILEEGKELIDEVLPYKRY